MTTLSPEKEFDFKPGDIYSPTGEPSTRDFLVLYVYPTNMEGNFRMTICFLISGKIKTLIFQPRAKYGKEFTRIGSCGNGQIS